MVVTRSIIQKFPAIRVHRLADDFQLSACLLTNRISIRIHTGTLFIFLYELVTRQGALRGDPAKNLADDLAARQNSLFLFTSGQTDRQTDVGLLLRRCNTHTGEPAFCYIVNNVDRCRSTLISVLSRCTYWKQGSFYTQTPVLILISHAFT